MDIYKVPMKEMTYMCRCVTVLLIDQIDLDEVVV